jgi:hypothetical protein
MLTVIGQGSPRSESSSTLGSSYLAEFRHQYSTASPCPNDLRTSFLRFHCIDEATPLHPGLPGVRAPPPAYIRPFPSDLREELRRE